VEGADVGDPPDIAQEESQIMLDTTMLRGVLGLGPVMTTPAPVYAPPGGMVAPLNSMAPFWAMFQEDQMVLPAEVMLRVTCMKVQDAELLLAMTISKI